MKTIVTLAAFAAFTVLASTGLSTAQSFTLSADEKQVCQTLELAHEATCAEYAAKLFTDAADITGSIAADQSWLPYTNGMGDPAGLTLTPADDITGSVKRMSIQLPYANGLGDPDGLTLSN